MSARLVMFCIAASLWILILAYCFGKGSVRARPITAQALLQYPKTSSRPRSRWYPGSQPPAAELQEPSGSC
jgi:hypothetical protein